MKKKNIIFAILGLLVVVGIIYFVAKKPKNTEPEVTEKPSLPINDIPIKERPFITLSPDSSGRNITLLIDNTEVKDTLEYELVYQAGDKQEGAFGRIDLEDEELPVEKNLLLGSKSAGGSVTYHEGITGGSLTVTYAETKLKESFNFQRYDSDEEEYSSVDSRLTATFPARTLSSNDVIIFMKTFGLPASVEGEILAGPYAILNSDGIAPETLSFKLSSITEGVEPTLLEYSEDGWEEVDTELSENTLTAESLTGYIFVVSSK